MAKGVLGIISYHPQCGESTYHQPQDVEQRVKVDVVGDEEDHTMPKKTITLMEHKAVQMGLEHLILYLSHREHVRGVTFTH